eukprot:TRINITY_DN2538_c0_g2_i1.p1 TRINITY_DN2538_c0_g2~~TRINITY_DN2538_c0_g2_i1.p1  ORF type:complete len:687 (-),score=98.28 TRINITY_DN2538_c0_g2_i1:22-2046(-)
MKRSETTPCFILLTILALSSAYTLLDDIPCIISNSEGIYCYPNISKPIPLPFTKPTNETIRTVKSVSNHSFVMHLDSGDLYHIDKDGELIEMYSGLSGTFLTKFCLFDDNRVLIVMDQTDLYAFDASGNYSGGLEVSMNEYFVSAHYKGGRYWLLYRDNGDYKLYPMTESLAPNDILIAPFMHVEDGDGGIFYQDDLNAIHFMFFENIRIVSFNTSMSKISILQRLGDNWIAFPYTYNSNLMLIPYPVGEPQLLDPALYVYYGLYGNGIWLLNDGSHLFFEDTFDMYATNLPSSVIITSVDFDEFFILSLSDPCDYGGSSYNCTLHLYDFSDPSNIKKVWTKYDREVASARFLLDEKVIYIQFTDGERSYLSYKREVEVANQTTTTNCAKLVDNKCVPNQCASGFSGVNCETEVSQDDPIYPIINCAAKRNDEYIVFYGYINSLEKTPTVQVIKSDGVAVSISVNFESQRSNFALITTCSSSSSWRIDNQIISFNENLYESVKCPTRFSFLLDLVFDEIFSITYAQIEALKRLISSVTDIPVSAIDIQILESNKKRQAGTTAELLISVSDTSQTAEAPEKLLEQSKDTNFARNLTTVFRSEPSQTGIVVLNTGSEYSGFTEYTEEVISPTQEEDQPDYTVTIIIITVVVVVIVLAVVGFILLPVIRHYFVQKDM